MKKKIEIKDIDITPNAIVLEDPDILTKTCDIYKINLSKKEKGGQILNRDICFNSNLVDINDVDFYLLRVKNSILSFINDSKFRVYYQADSCSDPYEINSLDELVDCIDDYIAEGGGECVVSRVDNKDHVYYIPYLDNLLV